MDFVERKDEEFAKEREELLKQEATRNILASIHGNPEATMEQLVSYLSKPEQRKHLPGIMVSDVFGEVKTANKKSTRTRRTKEVVEKELPMAIGLIKELLEKAKEPMLTSDIKEKLANHATLIKDNWNKAIADQMFKKIKGKSNRDTRYTLK